MLSCFTRGREAFGDDPRVCYQKLWGSAPGARNEAPKADVAADEQEGGASNGEEPETAGTGPLPDRLVAELTAYRTAGLREALAQQPRLR